MKLEPVRQLRLDTPLSQGLAAQVAVYEVEKDDLPATWFIHYGVDRLLREVAAEVGVVHLDAVVVARRRLLEIVDEALIRLLAGDQLALRKFEKLQSAGKWASPAIDVPSSTESLLRNEHRVRLAELAALQLTRWVSADMLFHLALHTMMRQVHACVENGTQIERALADLEARMRDEVSEVLRDLDDPSCLWDLPDPEESALSHSANATIETTC